MLADLLEITPWRQCAAWFEFLFVSRSRRVGFEISKPILMTISFNDNYSQGRSKTQTCRPCVCVCACGVCLMYTVMFLIPSLVYVTVQIMQILILIVCESESSDVGKCLKLNAPRKDVAFRQLTFRCGHEPVASTSAADGATSSAGASSSSHPPWKKVPGLRFNAVFFFFHCLIDFLQNIPGPCMQEWHAQDPFSGLQTFYRITSDNIISI